MNSILSFLQSHVRITLLLILLALFRDGLVEADFLSSSQIELCTQTDANQGLNCNQKFVVTLSLTGGQNDTQSLQFTLNQGTDSTGQTKTLEYPWKIGLSKSAIQVAYPITYVQTVNNKPTEQVIFERNLLLYDECVDGGNAQNPTCGWYKDDNGNNIPNSQGYCCACSLAQDLGISDDTTRAGQTCSLFGSQSSSAHCLRFDTLWYEVFEIGNAEIFYTITLTIDKYNAGEGTGSGQYVEETIQISPSVPSAVSSDGSIIVNLIGDFSPPTQYSDFSDKYLMIPSSPPTDPRVLAGDSDWMLLDKELFDLSGDSCNKIGVSFYAFETESKACLTQVGSCLNNQPDDYYTSDEAKRQAGQVGEYFVDNWGDWVPISDEETIYMAFYQTSIQSSVITLTFSADDIQFVTNVSPGKILSAQVDQFEALSKNGKLQAVVQNIGSIVADFTLTVTDCSKQIMDIQAQEVSISASQTASFTFNIYSETGLEAAYQCTLQLLDSQADVLDTVIVYFNTSATDYNKGPQGGQNTNNNTDSSSDGIIVLLSCTTLCPNFFDIPCFVLKQCWSSIAKTIVLVAFLVIAVIILFKLIRTKAFWKFVCCCGYCGCFKQKKSKKRAKEKLKVKKQRDYSSNESSSDEEDPRFSRSQKRNYKTSRPPHPSSPLTNFGRPRTDEDELELIIAQSIPVFFLVSNGRSSKLLKRPGRNYSLVGHLLQMENDFVYEFSISKFKFQTLFEGSEGKYLPLTPPKELKEDYFITELSLDLIQQYIVTLPPSTHPCVNNKINSKGKYANRKQPWEL